MTPSAYEVATKRSEIDFEEIIKNIIQQEDRKKIREDMTRNLLIAGTDPIQCKIIACKN